ncbi:MAG: twin-arginine translocase TatA/TatE family subunit [Candidatus Rokubacteria bacterium]|nr:twin-arginine translocase TatA/TatE family subunit [Candidatus Rokubacteria bacterium]
MLDIGFQELLVIMVLALLVFGPDKLPELGRRLGRAMREFRRASDEFRSTIETNLNLNAIDDPVLPPPAREPAGVTGEVPAATPSVEAPSEAAVIAGAANAGAPPPDGGAGGSETPIAVMPTEPFCALRGGRLLHRSTCGWAARILETDRLVLKAASEGWELGLKACPVCEPQDGDAPS